MSILIFVAFLKISSLIVVMIDPSIAYIRVSGVFNAGDIGSFVSAVTSYFPVQASTTGNNSIFLQPRS